MSMSSDWKSSWRLVAEDQGPGDSIVVRSSSRGSSIVGRMTSK